jgi:hypothetical protein
MGLHFCSCNLTEDGGDNEEDVGNIGLEHLNLALLRAATGNFSEENKLGMGGFGEVFKVCI